LLQRDKQPVGNWAIWLPSLDKVKLIEK